MKFGTNLHNLRIGRNMTMEELAARVGCSKPAIYKYEHGIVTAVPYDKIIALANALSVSPGVLMGWENGINVNFSPHEEEVIMAYRAKPELQHAVDVLLGIAKEKNGSYGAMAN